MIFLFTFLAIAMQALFAFFEMACVSFNKVRLQYYVSIKKRRALWLNYLLQHPSRLFGTTLIGVNAALMIGSECSRRVYEYFGLNPDFAFLTQAPLVILFAELAPMFAARRHPEQAAISLVPIMVFIAKLLTPITSLFAGVAHLVHRLMGKKETPELFLSREEVVLAFEGGRDSAEKILRLKTMKAADLMTPIERAHLLHSHANLAETQTFLATHSVSWIPIYHKTLRNIVAVAGVRDLLRLDSRRTILDIAHSPWFVTKEMPLLQLLQQFRRNNQHIAVILGPQGEAVGLLSLERILTEILGESVEEESTPYFIDRTLSGDMLINDFNREFSYSLPNPTRTLSDLIVRELGHLPVKEEMLKAYGLEFKVEEPTLRGVKTLSVRSIKF